MTPPMEPNIGQLCLLGGAVALIGLGITNALARGSGRSGGMRVSAKAMEYAGVCLALASLLWHSFGRGSGLPLDDNFAALTTLALMLAGFTFYVQRKKPIPGLDWFLMPIVVLVLILAGLFGKLRPDAYRLDGVWRWTHLLSNFAGAAAFAIAAGMGALYLIASARLRRKAAIGSQPMGSLERLENLTHWAVSFGFALLTVGMVTGLVKVLEEGSHTQLGPHWMTSPKVILAFAVWVVYALALHTPITPAVRGRKSAMLSIVGFVLMFATLVAVQYMPRGQ